MEKSKSRFRIEQGPLKTFLFFLAFSAFIWVFVQYSKSYTEIIEMPIEYVNIPKDKILLDNRPKTLALRLRDNGFHIAMNRILPPKLQIDISDATQEKGKLVYDLEKQKSSVLAQLNVDYENANFLQNSLVLGFQQRQVKTVKVISRIEPGFAVGYSALNETVLKPDSVRVSGPQGIIDTITQVYTRSLKINNINHDISGKISLDTSRLGKLSFYNTEVFYFLKTDKFTEGKVTIPITPINVPQNASIAIFPKDIIVYYQVSLKDFESIKPSDFKVVVDLENAVDSDGYLLAQLVNIPNLVNNVRLNEKRIQFVIKR